jgi:hypothetical protein
MLVTHGFRPRHSLRERRPRELKTGAHGRASVNSEPRRRDRLPGEAMSEGARHAQSKAPVWLESLGRLFAKRTPRPKAAGPDVGAT